MTGPDAHPSDHECPACTPDLPESIPTWASQHEEEA